MYIELIAVLAFLIQQTVSISYPIFGTKRYHRGGATKHLVPAYNAIPQQYYDESAYVPVQTAVAAYPEYQDDAASYYYLPPRQESHYYGLPTYRGEYKPTPYYYAQGPSYSYYDDRQEQTNPLDDLHEEMLHEDQRERQRELPTGQETWYDKSGRQDKLTNAFLKNLIMYNNQMDNNNNEAAAGASGRVGFSGMAGFNKQQDYNVDDYDRNDFSEDYGDGSEYYEQQQPLPAMSQIDDYDSQLHYTDAQRHRKLPAQNYNDDDGNVRELKQLAKNKNRTHQKEQRQPSTHYNYQSQPQQQLQQQPLKQQQKPQHQQHYDYQQDSAYNGYDTEPEYDDDAWINWDSKRSNKQKHIELKMNTVRKPSTVAEHFKAQTTKPHVPTVKPINSATSTPVLSHKSDSQTIDAKMEKPTNVVDMPQLLLKGYTGQKEVVLPRPATPVRHPFSAPVMDILTHNSIHDKRDTKTQPKTNVYETIKQLLAMEETLKTKPQEVSKMQKRFVSSEESLVQELSGLKRMAA